MSSTTVVLSPTCTTTMGNHIHRWLTYGTVLLADTVAFATAGTMAVCIRFLFHAQFRPADWLSVAPALLLFFIVFAFSGLYPGIGCSPTDEFRTILHASTTCFLLLILISFFLREGLTLSRTVIFLAWIFTILLVPVCRRVLRAYTALQPWWGIATVVFGEPKASKMLVDLLQGHPRLGLRPVAFLSEDCRSSRPPLDVSPTVFQGDLSHAARLAAANPGAYALVAMPTSGSDRIRTVISEYANHYHNILVIPDLFGLPSLAVTGKDICGVLTLQLDQRLKKLFPRLCKRTFDLTLSISALLVLSPLFLVLYLAVRLSSEGPAFYGQRRIGRNERSFKVWKFRSMLVNADDVLRAHLEKDPALRAEWCRDHKLKRDPRVTTIGRWLRKSSLDELPQLWNVVCGEMSLVGPRPIVEAEIEKYGDCFDQYRQVSPGVTGLWQVSGRNNTTYDLRIRIDNYYVRNWSLSLDTYILLRTMKTLLLSEGAY